MNKSLICSNELKKTLRNQIWFSLSVDSQSFVTVSLSRTMCSAQELNYCNFAVFIIHWQWFAALSSWPLRATKDLSNMSQKDTRDYNSGHIFGKIVSLLRVACCTVQLMACLYAAAGRLIIHAQRASEAVHDSEIEINPSLLEISQLTIQFYSAVENFRLQRAKSFRSKQESGFLLLSVCFVWLISSR